MMLTPLELSIIQALDCNPVVTLHGLWKLYCETFFNELCHLFLYRTSFCQIRCPVQCRVKSHPEAFLYPLSGLMFFNIISYFLLIYSSNVFSKVEDQGKETIMPQL